MPKYVIERDLAGAGALTSDELDAVSRTSVDVLNTMAPAVQWMHSYVTDDKLFCIYLADSPEAVREHATRGGFPVTAIHKVSTVIDPSNAERVPTV